MRAAEQDAWEALDAARRTLDHRGIEPRCAGHWASFTADDTDTLQRAAQLCTTCPLLDTCAGVVPFAFHGAWAGQVRVNGKTITTEKETNS